MLSINGNYLQDAQIIGNNIVLNMTGEAYIGYSTIETENLELTGVLQVWNGVVFEGNITVTDTLQNRSVNHLTLQVNGNVTNNGIIRNNVSALTLNISGDVINNGVWTNSTTNIIGTVDQEIVLFDGQSINNQVKFHAMISGNSYQWFKDGEEIEGATSSILEFDSLTVQDYGSYVCEIDGTILSREIEINSGGLEKPENISISIVGNTVVISWNVVENAASYKIYSSNEPYSETWILEQEGITDTTWSQQIVDGKKFYYVTAVSD